ncbi:MAG: glycosyltransferase family 39 protein [Planctomycetes bacterium]|nr:glycosyltransferase family 39 protein [Planctomycetota bacterium]
MSRSHRRPKGLPKRTTPSKSKPGRIIPPAFLPVILVWALAAIPFGYGKYLEFNNNGAFDGGLNVYHAKCLVNGDKIGKEVFPSARPATLLVNVMGVKLLGFSERGPKLIQTLMQLAALALMFYTLRKIYGILPASVALILAAFYLSCPPYAKVGNVKEQYMIACMIAAACGLILSHAGGSRLWLILSGAAAINTWYFKQTGFSIVIAMLIFLLVRSLFRNRTWRMCLQDLLWLYGGAILGMIPLVLFYIWQGTVASFLKKFPASVLVSLFLFVLGGLAIYLLVRLIPRDKVLGLLRNILGPLRKVRRSIWVVSAALGLLAMAAGWFYLEKKFPEQGQGNRFFFDLYFIDFPLMLVSKCRWTLIAMIDNVKHLLAAQGGYLVGSRSVTSFAAQAQTVMGHYKSFVVPIGLSLLAIGFRLVRLFSRKHPDASAEPSQSTVSDSRARCLQDSFVVLLAVWWILDMLFVWISPRSYVEYYLPLNASAAMLAAYAIYGAREIIVNRIAPNTNQLPVVGSVGIFLLVSVMMLVLSTKNLSLFADKVGQTAMMRSQKQLPHWEQVAQSIRNNTSPDDGLYVWGWVPGIYVQAQRFCPASHPAESNMHSDDPRRVHQVIRKLLAELKENPPTIIVDSQKDHFPYISHPRFDLWPRVFNRASRKFDLKPPLTKPSGQPRLIKPSEIDSYHDALMDQVETYTYDILTYPQRPGGSLAQEDARKRAQQERARHEMMTPLRKFVMTHYQPQSPVNSPMYIFRLKTNLPRIN